jgi:AbrB family looped-hinge helix DNA binding protein
MTYSGSVTSKGQVTVPKEIRERLGLKTGDRLEFVVEKGRTIVRKQANPAETNPFDKYVGFLGPFPGGERAWKAWLRDLRDEDE